MDKQKRMRARNKRLFTQEQAQRQTPQFSAQTLSQESSFSYTTGLPLMTAVPSSPVNLMVDIIFILLIINAHEFLEILCRARKDWIMNWVICSHRNSYNRALRGTPSPHCRHCNPVS